MKRILPLLLLLLLLVTGCRKKAETPTETEAATPDSTMPTPSHAAAPDTTIYGVATDDFGMSTFALVTERGDTLDLMRSHDDGTDATFYGDVVPGHRYALTLTDHGNSVGTALNLTQLEATTKDYAVHNARLILHPTTQPDTVNIERLDGKMLVARGRHLYRLPARK